MHYKLRHVQEKIKRLAQHSKVILIVGARQVGKSTLLKNLFPSIPRIVFERTGSNYGASTDPGAFLRQHPSPLILDEVQYVPQLFSSIKRIVDECDSPGRYFLTGSHNLGILKHAAESMAGRVCIVDLEHMTFLEESEAFTFTGDSQNPPSWLEIYLEKPDSLPFQFAGLATEQTPAHAVWRGGFPAFLDVPDKDLFARRQGYLETYLFRDAIYAEPTAANTKFERFLEIKAVLSGQEITHEHFGRELGLEDSLIARWDYILQQTYQWREIPPYFGNALKRVTKRAKGYMTDSGLACQLQGIYSPLSLLGDRQFGPLFETYCVNMLHGLMSNLDALPRVYHWRSKEQEEVDILLHMNGKLYPIEIKTASRVSKDDTRGIMALRETYGAMVQHGIILYTGTLCYHLNDHVTALPFNALMKQRD